jgi:hypothetical protein
LEKRTLKAVYEADLKRLLESLGLLKEFEEGKLRCPICGTIITVENFWGLYPSGQEVKVCCSDPNCYMKISPSVRSNEPEKE